MKTKLSIDILKEKKRNHSLTYEKIISVGHAIKSIKARMISQKSKNDSFLLIFYIFSQLLDIFTNGVRYLTHIDFSSNDCILPRSAKQLRDAIEHAHFRQCANNEMIEN